MRVNCPHCEKKFDIPIKTLCDWVENNEKTRKAVQATVGRYYSKKSNPANMSRGTEGGKKAAAARWAGHVKKKKVDPSDLGI